MIRCGCLTHCGDDNDIDGPGVCCGLPRMPTPPLVELVLVPRCHALDTAGDAVQASEATPVLPPAEGTG